jgi:transcriptional regulator with GAF, ATPase, and Fis domain
LAPLAAFSRGTMPVLVLGETGTGKELVARQVHRLGPRADGPFVVFDCTTISDTLGLSQLFGHVRGAFTGADRDRMGPFELARGGTIFLDEIGELPPAGQAMLLRVLQEGEIVRVGESLPRKVDVWVVAATHRDLAAEVRAGSFREDLFFRLSVAEVMLPPLRERRGDVELLTDAFLARFAREYGERAVSAEVRKHLEAHPWPGNVRELEGVVHRAAALAREGTIHPEHLRLRSGAGEPPGDYHRRIEDYRRELVRDALRAAGGNRSQAARVLGITRQALSYLVKQLEIEL